MTVKGKTSKNGASEPELCAFIPSIPVLKLEGLNECETI